MNKTALEKRSNEKQYCLVSRVRILRECSIKLYLLGLFNNQRNNGKNVRAYSYNLSPSLHTDLVCSQGMKGTEECRLEMRFIPSDTSNLILYSMKKGRVVILLAGRRAGKKAVIVKQNDEGKKVSSPHSPHCWQRILQVLMHARFGV